MGDIPDIRNDLPTSMIMAAFAGISWYIGAEINTSLFMVFKRRRGLYFWSCALASWGVVLQPLFIMLADFGVWTNLKGSITMIYLTWMIMVVPQSWVLFSRLHLVIHDERVLRWIKAVLLFTSIAFTVPTIVVGIIAQTTTTNPHLFSINTSWDRVQLIVFFVQETTLSILYIYQTRKYLHDRSLLLRPSRVPSPTSACFAHATSLEDEDRRVLYHLVYTNLLVIALDITLLGIQCANLFYVQGAFKPCVYGIKLKVEFAILNRLVKSVRARGNGEAACNNGCIVGTAVAAPAAATGEEVAGGGGVGNRKRRSMGIWGLRPRGSGGGDRECEMVGMGMGHLDAQKGFSTHSSQGSRTPVISGR
ncbi:integral membrane protein [Biscogniauxia mediterranea]|nr:integral membrane protein [Biscogniauxia mediterranea]